MYLEFSICQVCTYFIVTIVTIVTILRIAPSQAQSAHSLTWLTVPTGHMRRRDQAVDPSPPFIISFLF